MSASLISSKAANTYQFKTGQRKIAVQDYVVLAAGKRESFC